MPKIMICAVAAAALFPSAVAAQPAPIQSPNIAQSLLPVYPSYPPPPGICIYDGRPFSRGAILCIGGTRLGRSIVCGTDGSWSKDTEPQTCSGTP